MDSIAKLYREWATLGMLVQDPDLAPLWAVPPNVFVVPANRHKYGDKHFMVVKIGLRPPEPGRDEVWSVVRRTFEKILSAGLLQGLLGLQVVYNVWEGGPLGRAVLSVCTETRQIRQLLGLSASELRTNDKPKGVMCTWDKDLEGKVIGGDRP